MEKTFDLFLHVQPSVQARIEYYGLKKYWHAYLSRNIFMENKQCCK